MLGCYDFCGHYEATFQWLEAQGGAPLLHQYWDEAISRDSQRHAREAITRDGFAGMASYWGHTLAEESPDQGYYILQRDDLFRIDIHDCPSKGFLLRNRLEQHADYCDHCAGWISPVMDDAGFALTHEHNHCGQCWWEFRRKEDPTPASEAGACSPRDARLLPSWREGKIDHVPPIFHEP